ncbi:MAG: ribose-5-phosphate isomerase RpiA [Planctomycetota bacterium]
MNGKVSAGRAAAALVHDGMLVGLGTGSTAECFLEALGQRIRAQQLRIRGVPTSERTATLARQLGLTLIGFDQATVLDLAVDGADEIAPDLSLIKGGGGALLREKVVAWSAREMVVIATREKLVAELGATFALPLEVLPFAAPLLLARLRERQLDAALRTRDGKPSLTDNGNHVIDVRTGPIRDARSLDASLRGMPGVLETGLFLGLATRALIGHEDGHVEERTR